MRSRIEEIERFPAVWGALSRVASGILGPNKGEEGTFADGERSESGDDFTGRNGSLTKDEGEEKRTHHLGL